MKSYPATVVPKSSVDAPEGEVNLLSTDQAEKHKQ